MDTKLILLAVPALALSIAFHEMMHAFASDALGDDTARRAGRISLNPLKHIDPFMTIGLPLVLLLVGLPPFGAARPVPFNQHRVRFSEFGVALIALAGPLANLLLAAIVGLIYRVFLPSDGLFLDALVILLQVNIGFFVFNLIPFPPLDGSRVLYAFAPEPLQTIMRQIEALGMIGLVIFMFVLFPLLQPIFYNLSDFFINLIT